MIRSGFTVVELVITITIMGILLTLAVVNLNSTQANARDAERKGDVESLSLQLEAFYRNGVENPSAGVVITNGSYPGTVNVANETAVRNVLRDIDPKLLRGPGVSESSPISVVPATNTNQTPTGVAPQPTLSTYVYQPLRNDGGLCTNPASSTLCQKFNLYYLLESENAVQMVTSKNQ